MQLHHEQVLTFAAAVDRLIALKAQAALTLEEHHLVRHCIAELEEIFLVPEAQEIPLPWLTR
jgi:hypothetical protein